MFYLDKLDIIQKPCLKYISVLKLKVKLSDVKRLNHSGRKKNIEFSLTVRWLSFSCSSFINISPMIFNNEFFNFNLT